MSLSEPKTSVHSSKGRLVVTRTDPLSYLWLKTSKRSSAPVLERGTKPSSSTMSSLSRASFFCRLEQSPLVPGLDQLMDQRGCGGEADRQPPLAGGQPQAEGDMGLAGPTVADGYDVLTPLYVLAARQLHDQVLVHRRHGQEVECVEALCSGEARSFDPALDHSVMAVYELKLREPQEVARMVDVLGGTLAGHLAVLPQEGGQLQLLEVVLQQHRRPVAHRPAPAMSAM